MELNRWWENDPAEKYWMEVTERPDVGADLHAPELDDSDRETPTYSLVREVRDGDVVFHYDKAQEAITGWSIAQGGYWEAPTLWGTPRSTGPSGAPVEPYERPGLFHGLHGPFPLPQPLTRAELTAQQDSLRQLRDGLQAEHGSIYFPFQLRSDGVRGAQGYLLKMPAAVVAGLAKLASVADVAVAPPEIPPPDSSGEELGQPYVWEDEDVPPSSRDPFPVDPAVAERGLRSHRRLQNQLANHVQELGFTPRRPNPENPRWDLLWHQDGTTWVAEVKSLTAKNEERQLRLGLGQLLRYRHRLEMGGTAVNAVLAIPRQPTDPEWGALCDALGIRLVWPEVFAERIP